MQKYDIFLVCAPKDFNKIPYCLAGIFKNLKGFENVYLCTPQTLSQKIVSGIHYPIHYRLDMDVLPAKPQLWKYRPNWVYQQFLKLFQNETKNNYYFVVDCDTIINRPMKMFDDDGRPIWYISWEQNNPPYYRFCQKMFGFGRVYSHSFLADMGFYSKSIVRDMLSKYGYTVESFIKKSYLVVSKTVYPSEADIYMGYNIKWHQTTYAIKELKHKCDAKEGNNPLEPMYTVQEIEDHIKKMSKTDYDTFAIHSWVDKSHNTWQRG